MTHPTFNLTRVCHATQCLLACIALGAWSSAALAAPLSLAQVPAGGGGSSAEPAPNVILTIDDSGSMGYSVDLTPVTASNPSRMELLKQALVTQFGSKRLGIESRIADNRIRLAWQAMAGANPRNTYAKDLTPGDVNSMRPFAGTHKENFQEFARWLTADGSTPTHRMLINVFNYLRTPEGKDSPWADNPGVAQTTPYLSCRRTYHILMTDGTWTGGSDFNGIKPAIGNIDGNDITLPDGVVYDTTPIQGKPVVQLYMDKFGTVPRGNPQEDASTLADWTMKLWATDLQDGTGGTQNMPNKVKPLIKKPGNEVFTKTLSTGKVQTTTLPEYWNPKNDPATWQHVTQFTIGFGVNATKWIGDPKWDTTTNDMYGGDYPNLVDGSVSWPNAIGFIELRGPELWHMALNGRGRYYPANSGDALNAAFEDILGTIVTETSARISSVATNSKKSNLVDSVYQTAYDSATWSGSLDAYVAPKGLRPPDAKPVWSAAAKLDSTTVTPSSRTILTTEAGKGVPFNWTQITTKQTVLDDSDKKGSARLDYLRGERSGEGGSFRTRSTRLGDIVNSQAWYVDRPRASLTTLPGYSSFVSSNARRTPMVYVGANDGMLHGFDASNTSTQGKERIAYVPEGVYSKLVDYTRPAYSHQYTVDGSPFTGDVRLKDGTWRTYLAGSLAGGGKGYFVLDVTDPTQFNEANAASLVVLDTTAITDADIGNIYAHPSKEKGVPEHTVQFAQMNNDRPALILGNGVNSTNECPVLLIQYLDDKKERVKVPATCAATGTGNGLSNPQVIDLNNDGKADVVYAGDLLGNLWKFDLTNSDPTKWAVALSGKPLFTAKSAKGVAQPITTAPIWLFHPKGGIQLGFLTGRNMTVADRSDASEQTIYGIWDNTTVLRVANKITLKESADNVISAGRASLVELSGSMTLEASNNGTNFSNMKNGPSVNYSSTGTNPNRRGWFRTLTTPMERARTNALWVGDGGNWVEFLTLNPAVSSGGGAAPSESCTATAATTVTAESGNAVYLDLINGAAPTDPIFDTNADGTVNEKDKVANVSNGSAVTADLSGPGGSNSQVTPNGPPLESNTTGKKLPPRSTGWRER